MSPVDTSERSVDAAGCQSRKAEAGLSSVKATVGRGRTKASHEDFFIVRRCGVKLQQGLGDAGTNGRDGARMKCQPDARTSCNAYDGADTGSKSRARAAGIRRLSVERMDVVGGKAEKFGFEFGGMRPEPPGVYIQVALPHL